MLTSRERNDKAASTQTLVSINWWERWKQQHHPKARIDKFTCLVLSLLWAVTATSGSFAHLRCWNRRTFLQSVFAWKDQPIIKTSLHPLSIALEPLRGAGADPSWHWLRATTKTGHQLITGPTYTTIHAHIRTNVLFEWIYSKMHVGVWEETGAPGENPQRHIRFQFKFSCLPWFIDAISNSPNTQTNNKPRTDIKDPWCFLWNLGCRCRLRERFNPSNVTSQQHVGVCAQTDAWVGERNSAVKFKPRNSNGQEGCFPPNARGLIYPLGTLGCGFHLRRPFWELCYRVYSHPASASRGFFTDICRWRGGSGSGWRAEKCSRCQVEAKHNINLPLP